MDSLKPCTYPHPPDCLEKAQPLNTDPYDACSAQSSQSHRRRSSLKRRLIALGAVALGTWLVYSYARPTFGQPHPIYVWRWEDDHLGSSSLADRDGDQCIGGTNWTSYYDQPPWMPDYPYGAESTFSLPLDSNTLFLLSQGELQHGLVNIEQSTQVLDAVDVRIRVAYFDDNLLERATVCRTERADKEYGVGIFTPSWRSPRLRPSPKGTAQTLEFDVTLTLPAANEVPLSVKRLETKMPNYSQNVAGLQDSVLFESVSLASANGRLSVQSITAVAGEFTSLNGDIDGRFSARSALELRTANGRITPEVTLLHNECAGPSNLTIYTTNGQIDAEISLSSEALIGGEFGVDAKSTRGDIQLKFTDSPVDSVLRCQADTAVGAIQVELNSAFEGTYSLQTLLGAKLVSQHDVEDPAKRGRRRVVALKEARGRVEGDVKWVESDGSSSANEGYVILKTLVSSVDLIL